MIDKEDLDTLKTHDTKMYTQQDEVEALRQELLDARLDIEELVAIMKTAKDVFFKAAQEAVENNFVDGNAKWPHVKDIIESRIGKPK